MELEIAVADVNPGEPGPDGGTDTNADLTPLLVYLLRGAPIESTRLSRVDADAFWHAS